MNKILCKIGKFIRRYTICSCIIIVTIPVTLGFLGANAYVVGIVGAIVFLLPLVSIDAYYESLIDEQLKMSKGGYDNE